MLVKSKNYVFNKPIYIQIVEECEYALKKTNFYLHLFGKTLYTQKAMKYSKDESCLEFDFFFFLYYFDVKHE